MNAPSVPGSGCALRWRLPSRLTSRGACSPPGRARWTSLPSALSTGSVSGLSSTVTSSVTCSSARLQAAPKPGLSRRSITVAPCVARERRAAVVGPVVDDHELRAARQRRQQRRAARRASGAGRSRSRSSRATTAARVPGRHAGRCEHRCADAHAPTVMSLGGRRPAWATIAVSIAASRRRTESRTSNAASARRRAAFGASGSASTARSASHGRVGVAGRVEAAGAVLDDLERAGGGGRDDRAAGRQRLDQREAVGLGVGAVQQHVGAAERGAHVGRRGPRTSRSVRRRRRIVLAGQRSAGERDVHVRHPARDLERQVRPLPRRPARRARARAAARPAAAWA